MKFDVVLAQKNGAIELSDVDLQSVYGGRGGSSDTSTTSIPIGPINLNDLEVLDLIPHLLGANGNTLGSSNPLDVNRSTRSSGSEGDDD